MASVKPSLMSEPWKHHHHAGTRTAKQIRNPRVVPRNCSLINSVLHGVWFRAHSAMVEIVPWHCFHAARHLIGWCDQAPRWPSRWWLRSAARKLSSRAPRPPASGGPIAAPRARGLTPSPLPASSPARGTASTTPSTLRPVLHAPPLLRLRFDEPCVRADRRPPSAGGHRQPLARAKSESPRRSSEAPSVALKRHGRPEECQSDDPVPHRAPP